MMLTVAEAIQKALDDAFAEDPKRILLGEDIGAYGGVFRATQGLQARYGSERVLDTPISEAGFVGFALGAALTGLRPMVEIMFFDFALVAMDQLLNQVAKVGAMSGNQVEVPFVVRTQGGNYRGTGAQHGQMLEAIFTHVPGFQVVVISNPDDAYGLLRTACRSTQPVLFVEHKMLYSEKGPVTGNAYPLGKARTRRVGSAATVLTYGYGVKLATSAVEQSGIDAEILDLRSLVPLDFESIAASVRKTHRVIVVHEAHRTAGFGAELSARIGEELFDDLDAPVQRIGALDEPLPYAETLEKAALPQPEQIILALREVI